jgi:hypothetical protein
MGFGFAVTDLTFVKNDAVWDKEFNSPTGMVGRDLRQRARRVERAAKVQVGKDTRNLHRLIRTEMHRGPFGPVAEVGAMVEPGIGYAYWHHEGTRPHLISAQPRHLLRFSSGNGAQVYRHTIRHPGTRPNRYLSDNLPLAVI